MSTTIKPTIGNIISLWFGVDTPLRRHRIQLNPVLWSACQRTGLTFNPPSKVKEIERYRSADRMAFAKAVQQELERSQVPRDRRVSQVA